MTAPISKDAEDSTAMGTWRTIGYNKCFVISAERFLIHDLSEISCITSTKDIPQVFYQAFDRMSLDTSGQLQIYARGGITRYRLTPLRHLPQACQSSSRRNPANLVFNFEVFWHYFKENYAFFDLRRVDWEKVYTDNYSYVSHLSNDQELADVLEKILREINDSHATLEIPGQTITTRKPHALVRQWQNEFHSKQFLELYPRGIPVIYNALNNMILHGQGRSALNGQLLWGKISPGIGYLAIFSLMDMYASFDLLHYAGFEVTNLYYIRSLAESIDQAIADLSDADALILDLRFNPGGHDGAGKVVASRFADRRRLAFSKQAYDHNILTPAQEIFIEPDGKSRFLRPVMLLTSEATASAAEVLVHFMMTLPHVTRLGGTTRGVLSDTLLMRLPIGWTTSISNEIYTAADGVCYESSGIPPQIEAATFFPEDFYQSLFLTVQDAMTYL
jgi:carboxyl-terminal processing protease